MNKAQITISSNVDINAIYFGITLSGYEYADIDKSDDITKRLQQIRHYSGLDEAKEYFSRARQSTCVVYPFWPRVALLEIAIFFINDKGFDYDGYCTYVKARSNLTDEEKSDDFFCWIKDFTKYLIQIKSDSFFQDINRQLSDKVNKISASSAEKIDLIKSRLDSLSASTVSAISTISLIICPIKCVYSADYFAVGPVISVILGDFLPHSIVHEYLHPIVHSCIQKHREHIVAHNERKYLNLDQSYHMGNDENGKLNAFEENIVRIISDLILDDVDINIEQLILDELNNQHK